MTESFTLTGATDVNAYVNNDTHVVRRNAIGFAVRPFPHRSQAGIRCRSSMPVINDLLFSGTHIGRCGCSVLKMWD